MLRSIKIDLTKNNDFVIIQLKGQKGEEIAKNYFFPFLKFMEPLNFNQIKETTTYTYDAGTLIETKTIKDIEFLNTIYLLGKIIIPIIIFFILITYKRKK